MRRPLAVLGVACAMIYSGRATAQQSTPSDGAGASTAAMPGQVVGTGYTLNPAGASITKAAPQAGKPIGNPLARPYDPSKPLDVFNGTNIDPSTVVTPISGFPSIPTQQSGLLGQLNNTLSSVTNFFNPTYPVPPRTFTPGIFRRDKERMKARWRVD